MTYVYYNLTNITSAGNQTTILTFVKGVNDAMNYGPTILILMAISIVLFLTLISKGFNPYQCFAATSWVFFIFTLILYPMQLIPGKIIIVSGLLLPLSVALLFIFGGQDFG